MLLRVDIKGKNDLMWFLEKFKIDVERRVDGKPWYADGLKFACERCGVCCSGGPGNVWVDKKEITAIAERLSIPTEQFIAQFVKKVRRRFSLRENENGDCIFFRKEMGCEIYGCRPKQCQTWPFWESNILSWQEWKDTCQRCPGAGVGELHGLEDIEKKRKLRNM